MTFLTSPGLVPVPKSDTLWYLDADLVVEIGHPLRGFYIKLTVPRGFVTDLASVPELLRSAINAFGRHTMAAVIHDWLYFLGCPSKEIADMIFLLAMENLNVPEARAKLMTYAVSGFGQSAWENHRHQGHCFATFKPYVKPFEEV